MKVSFIATVLNEEKTIKSFLNSIFVQSKLPDEIIIVDGGSSDGTIAKIKNEKIKIITKVGNRSVGRNEAIKRAGNEIIVCSDAGCILDKDWVKNISRPFENPKIDVVAGYYKANAKTIFQKCLTPYVLVMQDKVNEKEFLPATRSMAFKKTVWKKAGEFNEKYSHNEDYVFAKRLKGVGANIIFEKKATVSWTPLRKLGNAFKMFFRFALGDSESGIFREKVLYIFARYFLLIYFLLIFFVERSTAPLYLASLGMASYIVWIIKKNYKYVQDARAFFFLPLMQFASDFAVMSGTSVGLLNKIKFEKVYSIIRNNKWVALIIGLYTVLMILLINWGIPNPNHPFNYFMDEWHQAQAVRTVFSQGSPNVPGSANGSMFHFLLSGLLIIPFIAVGIVNPFAIGSSVEALKIQQNLFQILRLNTLFFGVASIILIGYIAKKYFKLNPFVVSFLFTVNPIWLMLSNYFKYDIALIFWIILSFLFILRYSVKPSFMNYGLAAFASGLAFSVKVSALPLLPILFISYVLFTQKRKDNLKQLGLGIHIFFLTFLAFGIPDLLFGKGNINEYLYDNLVRTPDYASNYILGTNYISYLIFNGASTVFGYFLFALSIISLFFTAGYLFKKKLRENINRRYLLIIISLLIFVSSLLFLKIEARGNRLLVLLPFMVLLSGIFIDKVLNLSGNYLKKIIIFALIVFLSLQALESFSWISLKLKSDLRQTSSAWIANNIPLGSTIGIENIPIYQLLPDLVLKEFYTKQFKTNIVTKFNYRVIDSSSSVLPQYVIVTNEDVDTNYLKKSFKKDLILDLRNKNYKKIYYEQQKQTFLSLFRDKLDYFISGMIQEPLSISLYKYP